MFAGCLLVNSFGQSTSRRSVIVALTLLNSPDFPTPPSPSNTILYMRSPPRKEADGGCIFPRIVVCVSLQQTSSITNGAGAEMFEQILSRISYKSSPRYFCNDT